MKCSALRVTYLLVGLLALTYVEELAIAVSPAKG